MAEQAGVRAFLLAEAQRHFRIGDVVNLVRPGAEQQAIHDPRHMAGNAAASLGIERMMGVSRCLDFLLKLSVTAGAHKVRLVFELE